MALEVHNIDIGFPLRRPRTDFGLEDPIQPLWEEYKLRARHVNDRRKLCS